MRDTSVTDGRLVLTVSLIRCSALARDDKTGVVLTVFDGCSPSIRHVLELKDVISDPCAELYIIRDGGVKPAGASFFNLPGGCVYVADNSYHNFRINLASALSIRTDVTTS